MATGTGESNVVSVRPYRKGDDDGVWSVLKEGSYSNVNPTFISCLRRREIQFIGLVLLSWLSVRGTSWTELLFCVTAFVTCIYLLSFLSVVVYLYGSTLVDVNDIQKSYFNCPGNHFWVAICDGQVVGTVAITKKPDRLVGSPDDPSLTPGNSKKVAWLRRMSVRKRYRGLGIAKKLVKECIAFCKEHEYESIFLITTEIHHAARSLYSKLGFELLSSPKPYKYTVVTVNTYEYEMKL